MKPTLRLLVTAARARGAAEGTRNTARRPLVRRRSRTAAQDAAALAVAEMDTYGFGDDR